MRLRRSIAMLAVFAGVLVTLPAAAEPAADLFKGRKVSIYVSTGPGGGYDAYGRMLARHLGRHLPGHPTVVVENMPGAGGRNVANFLYNVAPKDGTAIATMQHTTVYDALFGEAGVRYDARKFTWLGSMASFTSVGIAWHTSGVRTIEDAKTKQIVMGSSGAGATSFQWTNLMNHLIGTKFKILVGYKGAADMYVALERGELDGVAGTDWTSIRNGFQRWLDNKQINIFVQFATTPHPDLPKVPLIGDLVSSPEDKTVLRFVFLGLGFARPFLAPPDLPAPVAAALRRGFDAVAKDPALLAEAKKIRFDVDPVDGVTVQRQLDELYATPKPLIDRAKWALTAR
jgi:tripartite-type tricarboxylate transporter receptor subunit TctC